MNPMIGVFGVPSGVVDFASLISFAWVTFLLFITLPAVAFWLLEHRPGRPDGHDREAPYRKAA